MPTGRELNKTWGVGVKHALYRRTGDWYHVLKAFPAALFDDEGYVRFETRADLETAGLRVSQEKGKDWIAVPAGISKLPGYIKMAGTPQPSTSKPEGVPLKDYDESERFAVQQSGTVRYRHLHNKMTRIFGQMFASLKPEQGQVANERYDIRLRNYDKAGRDLLVEAKPGTDKGYLRIAIGQLYDYCRFLKNRSTTDLAVLTIGKPNQSYMDLLVSDRGITALWFDDETCKTLNGEGPAWRVLGRWLTSKGGLSRPN